MDTLTLKYVQRKGETFKSGISYSGREYLDFIVSGQSLGELFDQLNFNKIGTFGWSENKEYESKHIDEFLGNEQPELETGRSCFYVCPECGDIGCGAITAKIEITDENVVWKDFGYEDDTDFLEPDTTQFKNIGPFSFDKGNYYKVFENLKTLTTK
jgi:hypothetical protein